MKPLQGWEQERAEEPSTAERVVIILSTMAASCVFALFIALVLK